MGILDNLLPTAATPSGSTVSQTSMPEFYTDAVRGVLAQGANAAAAPRPIYPGQQTAGFTPDQLKAMEMIRGNVGSWQPTMQNAQNMFGQAGTAGQAAQAAVAGPAQKWTDNWQNYMSPYTKGVTDEIARLGTQNMTENLLPALNQSFIGAGGFGSTRNAGALTRTMRDVGQNILGQQATALESGYKTAADIFGKDATLAQNQGQLQAGAAINSGNIFNQAGSGLSSLAASGQTLQNNDVNALAGSGGLQQALGQTQLNNQYKDFQDASNYDWSQLTKYADLMKSMTVPQSQTSASVTGADAASPGALGWLTSLLGGGKAMSTTPTPTTPTPA